MKKKLAAFTLGIAVMTGAAGLEGVCALAAEGGQAGTSYATVTEVEYFAPSVTKVIVDFGTEFAEGTTVTPEQFTAHVARTYAGTKDLVQALSYETFTMAVSPTAEGDRKITAAYLSDAEGNETAEATSFVTLELEVGPEEGFGNPLGTETETGLNFNVVVDCNYTISFTDAEGNQTEITEKNDANSRIIGVDDFTLDQTFTTTTQEILDDGLENDALNYASYELEADGETHPLIIWLHGMGEGGTDTRVPLMGAKAVTLAEEEIQGYMGGAYVLVPQSPTVWMDTDGSGAINLTAEAHDSIYRQTLKELIDAYVAERSDIDTNRIYIGGCSNGGYMTMNMLIHYPDTFAAAYPVCEAYNDEFITDEEINVLKDIPIWFTHAVTDPLVVPDQYTVPTAARLTEAGAENMHFTYWTDVHDFTGLYNDADGNPYVYFGHASWQYALDNLCTMDNDYIDGKTADEKGTGMTMFEWLSQQSR